MTGDRLPSFALNGRKKLTPGSRVDVLDRASCFRPVGDLPSCVRDDDDVEASVCDLCVASDKSTDEAEGAEGGRRRVTVFAAVEAAFPEVLEPPAPILVQRWAPRK